MESCESEPEEKVLTKKNLFKKPSKGSEGPAFLFDYDNFYGLPHFKTMEDFDENERKLEVDKNYRDYLRKAIQQTGDIGSFELKEIFDRDLLTQFNFYGKFNCRSFKETYFYRYIYLRKYCFVFK